MNYVYCSDKKSILLSNVSINNVQYYVYEAIYNRPDIYLLDCTSNQTNFQIQINEKDFKDIRIIPAFKKACAEKYIQVDVSSEYSEKRCGHLLIEVINRMIEMSPSNRIKIPYYGGRDDNNPTSFTPPILDSQRQRYKSSPFEYLNDNSILQNPKNVLSFPGPSIWQVERLSMEMDLASALIFWCYYHYSFISAFIQENHEAVPPCWVCVPSVGDYDTNLSHYSSLIGGSGSSIYFEPILLSLPTKEICKKLSEVRDIPTLLIDDGHIGAAALHSKLLQIRYWNRDNFSSTHFRFRTAPFLCSNRAYSFSDIPLVILNTYTSAMDVPLLQATDDHQLIAYGYNFYQAFYFRIVQASIGEHVPNAWMSLMPSIPIVQNTIPPLEAFFARDLIFMYNLLQKIFHLNSQSLVNEESWQVIYSIQNDIVHMLSGVSVKDFSNDFYKAISDAIESKEIVCLARLDIESGELLEDPQQLDVKPCLLADQGEDVFYINKFTLDYVLRKVPGAPGVQRFLSSLKDSQYLVGPFDNKTTFCRKVRIRLKDGSATDKTVYCFQRRPLVLLTQPPCEEPPITGRSLWFGVSPVDGKDLLWDFDNPSYTNRHMLVTGSSGSGKSFFLSRMIEEAYSQDIPVVYFHLQGAIPQIFSDMKVINIAEEKPALSAMTNGDTKRLVHAICRSFRLRAQQENHLNKFFEENSYQLRDWLSFCENYSYWCAEQKVNASSALNAFEGIQYENPFSHEELDWENPGFRFLTLDFSSFSESGNLFTMQVELYLLDLYYSMIAAGRDESSPKVIVIDELQKISTSTGSSIDTLLREGRKYGCALWLSTQFIDSKFNDMKKLLAGQSEVSVYFQPNGRENSIARAITDTSKEARKWEPILKRLTKGECVIKLASKPVPLHCKVVARNDPLEKGAT